MCRYRKLNSKVIEMTVGGLISETCVFSLGNLDFCSVTV